MKYILLFFLYAASCLIQAEESEGIYFSHYDWEIACDNTRTCRAAGYQADDEKLSLSVLLTRKGGPATEVTAELRIGEQIYELSSAAELKINNKSLGHIKLADEKSSLLSKSQTDILLKALINPGRIEFIHDKNIYRLSDKGSTAVLLKMDEIQGRLDTPGALVRKGNRKESEVPTALAAPVVIKKPVLPATPLALDVPTKKSIENEIVYEGDYDDAELNVYPINDKYWLASRLNWRGAYNVGYSFWVINSKPPYKPLLITDNGTTYENGVIRKINIGRSMGDCAAYKNWIWNGETFVPSEVWTTGRCKLVTADLWTLFTLISEIRNDN